MNTLFRETDRQKERIEIAVEFMLYICKGCEHSFSLPLLPEQEKQAFLFPAGKKAYYCISFAEAPALYEELRARLTRYAYPYLNFDGFDREEFLHYAEHRLWADLIDREPGETVSSPLSEQSCPHCGSQKLKVIGRLLPCQGEEADFQIWRGTLEGFLALPPQERNRTMLLFLKQYAKEYREECNRRQTP